MLAKFGEVFSSGFLYVVFICVIGSGIFAGHFIFRSAELGVVTPEMQIQLAVGEIWSVVVSGEISLLSFGKTVRRLVV